MDFQLGQNGRSSNRRESPIDKNERQLYAVCALLFKWDKAMVDKQPTRYLYDTINGSMELLEEILSSIGDSVPQNFKSMGHPI